VKLTIITDLGEVEIETNSETGRVDSVFIDGIDFADKTVEEFVIAMIGGPEGWSKTLSEAEWNARAHKEERDRMEDIDGVPV
jgi:hypothetical protein